MNISSLSGLALTVVGECVYTLSQAPATGGEPSTKYDARGVLIPADPVTRKVKGRITTRMRNTDTSLDRGTMVTGTSVFTSRKRIRVPGECDGAEADQMPVITDTDGTQYRVMAPARKGCLYVYPLELICRPDC